jgi:hypothetical protein
MTGYVITMADEERRETVVRADSSADQALDVHTVVVPERGRWAVEIVVVFADGVVRKRINTHATKARRGTRHRRRAAERMTHRRGVL